MRKPNIKFIPISLEESIKKLQNEDLSGIDTIIIDLRGNWGGNSLLNMSLMDFLKRQKKIS